MCTQPNRSLTLLHVDFNPSPGVVIAGHFMASQFYGVRTWDPVMMVIMAAVRGTAAFLAAVILAKRAASVERMRALRVE